MTTETASQTYFRPINAETGQPTLAVHFTAPLCLLAEAHQYDLDDRIAALAADVRDHLDQLGLPIRPSIVTGRVRIVQEVVEGEEVASQPEVTATVLAFLTDAEPDDPRLEALAGGFRSERLDGAHVSFEVPTAASEAELELTIATERARGAAYVAKASAAAPAPTAAAADAVTDDVLGDLFG